jgi:hypothetical protein
MPYDPAVVEAIRRIGQQRKVPRRWLEAAYATGIVESGLQNLDYGDADSKGWRQERQSLYKNPTNLNASINRFYDELGQHDRGQSVGELAADVQRPAAQYRGRYAEVLDQARKLLGGGDFPTGTPTPQGIENGGQAAPTGNGLFDYLAKNTQAGPLQQTLQSGWNLLSRLSGQQTAPTVASTPFSSGSGGTGKKGSGQLEEFFYDPLGGWDKGVNIGAIGGHGDHAHIATQDKALLQKIAEDAAKSGLSVREFSPFDKVDPVHTKGSWHYKDLAADISGPSLMQWAKRIRKQYGLE